MVVALMFSHVETCRPEKKGKKNTVSSAHVPLLRLSELLVNCIYHLMQFASPLADTGVGWFIFKCKKKKKKMQPGRVITLNVYQVIRQPVGTGLETVIIR